MASSRSGSGPLVLTEAELSSLQTLVGLPRDAFENQIYPHTLHRWTLAQLKAITLALQSRLPPRFALRGTKAVQVAQLATALFETPGPKPAPAPAAAPRSHSHASPVAAATHGSIYGGSLLSQAEKDMIRGALHPYYEQITTISVSRVSSLRIPNSSHHQLRFQLEPHMLAQLDSCKGNNAVLIRFFKDTNDFQWWNDFHVILNGKTVDTRNKKIRVNTKHQSFITPYPADIAGKVMPGVNMIEFYYHNWQTTAILIIEYVRRRQQDDLVKLVPSTKSSASFTPSAETEDLMEMKQVLPLTCPITMLRMVIPAKGRLCAHVQTFDLATYIAFCNQAQVWNCPICQKPLPYHQLVRDDMITGILASTSPETSSVELDKHGHWTLGSESIPIDAGEESDGEQGPKRSLHSDNSPAGSRKAPRIDTMLMRASASPGGSSIASPAAAGFPPPAAAAPRTETVIVVSLQ